MTSYRSQLPQLSGDLFITDGGIETTLIFLDGLDLPSFAAFVLLDSDQGFKALDGYFRRYADLARKYRTGFILESPTWRASLDWATKLGYTDRRWQNSTIRRLNCSFASATNMERPKPRSW